ncbi:hypothetical protein ES703_90201 [subsurface metagenome]
MVKTLHSSAGCARNVCKLTQLRAPKEICPVANVTHRTPTIKA